MKFLSFILLIILFAGSVPAMADMCCKDEVSINDCHKDTSKKAENSCNHCLHHSHASVAPALQNNRFERMAEKLLIVLSERSDADFKYPLIDPPSRS